MVEEALIKEYFMLRDKIIEKEFDHLDLQQRNAVLTSERNLLVAACPGSGKTTVLVNRVLYLVRFGCIYQSSYYPETINLEVLCIMRSYLKEGKTFLNKNTSEKLKEVMCSRAVKIDKIIILTFTKAAAENMKRRFLKLSGEKAAPFFGTFHGLFYKLLLRHKGEIKIIENADAYKIIASTLEKYTDEVTEEKVEEIRNNISAYKASDYSNEEIVLRIDRTIFINCLNNYEKYKSSRRLYDFDDLQLDFKKLLVENQKLLQMYSKSFMHMLIDEFQDCDEVQIQTLMLLNRYNSVFAVGDEDQSIYSFRGSRPEFMVNFNSMFSKGIHTFLSTNYRSTENIVDLASVLIKNNLERNDKNMVPFSKERRLIQTNSYLDESMEAKDITALILKHVNEGGKFDEFAVLYRTNVESRSIIDNFIKNKIHFKLLDKDYNFFEHFICKDIIAYLKLSICLHHVESFKRIINKPFRYISNLSIKKLTDSKIRENCFEFIRNLEDTPIFQMKNLHKLEKNIKHLDNINLLSAIDFILEELEYKDYLSSYCEKFKTKLSDLFDIVLELKEAAKEFNSISEFIVHIENVKERLDKLKEKQSLDNAVIVSTIHGVKGMEFNNVFIINCVEELLPHKNNLLHGIEEERRLFFVAVTRARHNLYLCMPRQIRGKAKICSRFISECNLKVQDIQGYIYKKDDIVIHSSFGEGKVLSLDNEVIEISFDDLMSRRFDLRVLYNNGILRKA